MARIGWVGWGMAGVPSSSRPSWHPFAPKRAGWEGEPHWTIYDTDLLVCLFSFVLVSPEESWPVGEDSFLQEG